MLLVSSPDRFIFDMTEEWSGNKHIQDYTKKPIDSNK